MPHTIGCMGGVVYPTDCMGEAVLQLQPDIRLETSFIHLESQYYHGIQICKERKKLLNSQGLVSNRRNA